MALFTVAVVLHFFCILLLAFSTTPRAQARESQFFSKAERYTAPKEAATSAKGEELPAAKKDEEVHYKLDNGGGGYGLYGHGPERIPAATTASPAFPTYGYNKGAGENSNTESVPAEFNNEEVDGAVSYGNKEFNAAAGDRDMNMKYTGNTPAYSAGSNPQKYEVDGYKYNTEASTRYPNRGEQYGMSDTRFLDNGRYFYDQKTEDSYRNGRYDVEPAREKYPGGRYGSFGGGRTFANGGYSTFGNSINNKDDNNNNGESSGYEENNNSMQLGHRSNYQQEEYVP